MAGGAANKFAKLVDWNAEESALAAGLIRQFKSLLLKPFCSRQGVALTYIAEGDKCGCPHLARCSTFGGM